MVRRRAAGDCGCDAEARQHRPGSRREPRRRGDRRPRGARAGPCGGSSGGGRGVPAAASPFDRAAAGLAVALLAQVTLEVPRESLARRDVLLDVETLGLLLLEPVDQLLDL